ncbi:hypothetical protein RJ640_002962, partial [Escallonia rubra]
MAEAAVEKEEERGTVGTHFNGTVGMKTGPPRRIFTTSVLEMEAGAGAMMLMTMMLNLAFVVGDGTSTPQQKTKKGRPWALVWSKGALRSMLVSEGCKFDEGYYIQSFVGGLRDDIRLEIEKFELYDLSRAIYLARKQEASVQNTWHSPRTVIKQSSLPIYPNTAKTPATNSNLRPKPFLIHPNPPANPVLVNAHHKGLLPTPQNPHPQRLTRGYFDDRRRKGLCYWCDEVFTPAHNCKHKQVSMLVVDEEVEGDTPPVYDEEENITEDEGAKDGHEKVEITANAITGSSTHNTFKLWGQHKKKTFSILIDTGSTHNFLNPATAARLGCVITPTETMIIMVADGNKVESDAMCQDFSWTLQDIEFKSNMMVLPLGGCECVLGLQWLRKLGQVQFDFQEMTMTINVEGRPITLHRGNGKTEVKLLSAT